MKIKFIKPDPRSGSEAEMDSSRGQQLIEAGSAVQVSERADAKVSDEASTEVKAVADKHAKGKGKV